MFRFVLSIFLLLFSYKLNIPINFQPNLDKSYLSIDRIGVNLDLYSGVEEANALKKGGYVIPGSVNPLDDGNLIVAGHRLRLGAPVKNSFYYLPKIRQGDDIIVHWLGRDYHYTVDTVTIVEPTHRINVQAENKVLTLVTCTPLVGSTHRLVVTAVQNED